MNQERLFYLVLGGVFTTEIPAPQNIQGIARIITAFLVFPDRILTFEVSL